MVYFHVIDLLLFRKQAGKWGPTWREVNYVCVGSDGMVKMVLLFLNMILMLWLPKVSLMTNE